jgi:hypothetical protein
MTLFFSEKYGLSPVAARKRAGMPGLTLGPARLGGDDPTRQVGATMQWSFSRHPG